MNWRRENAMDGEERAREGRPLWQSVVGGLVLMAICYDVLWWFLHA